MPLSDTSIRSAKSKEKPYKLADEKGLFLLVNPSGSKYWRFKYRINGKEKLLSIGVYPDISLRDARDRRDEARKLLANGTDPGSVKKAQKLARLERSANSFEIVARRWHQNNLTGWTDSYQKKTMRLLEKDLFPWLGGLPVSDIEAPEFLSAVRRTESRGAVETAHRLLQCCGQVMRFAVAEGLAKRDPTGDLRGALKTAETKHMPTVTDPKKVGEILRMFDAFSGTYTVKCALLLAPMLFCRPGELRQARWEHIDLDNGMWSIPGEMMKMRVPHLVPLSTQAIKILKEIQPYSGHLEYVFPGGRDPKRPMSEAAINAALRRLGIDTKAELTGHGFRAMARTILHEQLGFQPEWIEAQLAHKPVGALGSAYNRTQFIEQRKKMMQTWADMLDVWKKGDVKVVPISRVA